MHAKSLQLCPTLQIYGLEPTRLLDPWDFQGVNTEAGWYALLHGNFSTRESNWHLLSRLKVKMKVAQSCVTFILQARILESVAFPFSREASQSGLEPRSPALQADSLPAEPQGKPKNIGVGSLSLLQGIFPTQESNQGLLHCRWILYQLSYQGSEKISCVGRKFFTTSACEKPAIFFANPWKMAMFHYCKVHRIYYWNKS